MSFQAAGSLTGPAKLAQVTILLEKLSSDLKTVDLLPHQRDAILEELKIYGRNPDNADPIFTKEGIEILTQHAYNSSSYTTSRNALRCLANAMLLRPAVRQIYVDLGYESKACDRLKNDNRDDEFLVSRVIFLTTYGTDVKIENMIDEHHLAEIIKLNLQRHAKLLDDTKEKAKDDPMQEMALIETLKLVFNCTHFCPQRTDAFLPAVPHILAIICRRQLLPGKPIDTAMGPLLNSLINLDIAKEKESMHAMFPKSENKVVAQRLIEILELSVKAYTDENIEQLVSPLLTLLRKVYEIAPVEVKTAMKTLVLPTDADRNQPLGSTDTFSSRLLRLSSSPMAPQAREAISALLFEMSDKDARTFVQNVGYGFASGFLFQHNVPIPENAMEGYSNSSEDASSSTSSRTPINPITGQRLDSESKFDGPEMTQAEKEREAEKLMVLFERLKKNGIINVENPVHQAQHEGRFTELDSDEDSE